jgi:hypothetical protein
VYGILEEAPTGAASLDPPPAPLAVDPVAPTLAVDPAAPTGTSAWIHLQLPRPRRQAMDPLQRGLPPAALRSCRLGGGGSGRLPVRMEAEAEAGSRWLCVCGGGGRGGSRRPRVGAEAAADDLGWKWRRMQRRTAAGGGGGERPSVGMEAGGRGSRRRQTTLGGGDKEDGAVSLREGERNWEMSQECGSLLRTFCSFRCSSCWRRHSAFPFPILH